ncbi:MAG: GNAT family N-acetyltransferase [Clostridiales bacterium]|nr:GNAT family N-acetyltransferase [Clostridiales bacterium]
MQLETERLMLRELTEDDFSALYAVLGDSDITEHYPYTFDEARVRRWIARNQERYRTDGFGLWAVIRKDTGELIGDCGLTMQPIHGEMLPEVGYHIRRDQQGKGYATEAAAACIRFAFANYDFPHVYSYMKYTNAASAAVAMKNGMRFVEEYPDPDNAFTRVYAVSREAFMARKERKD